jgi:hypothetical protein
VNAIDVLTYIYILTLLTQPVYEVSDNMNSNGIRVEVGHDQGSGVHSEGVTRRRRSLSMV